MNKRVISGYAAAIGIMVVSVTALALYATSSPDVDAELRENIAELDPLAKRRAQVAQIPRGSDAKFVDANTHALLQNEQSDEDGQTKQTSELLSAAEGQKQKEVVTVSANSTPAPHHPAEVSHDTRGGLLESALKEPTTPTIVSSEAGKIGSADSTPTRQLAQAQQENAKNFMSFAKGDATAPVVPVELPGESEVPGPQTSGGGTSQKSKFVELASLGGEPQFLDGQKAKEGKDPAIMRGTRVLCLIDDSLTLAPGIEKYTSCRAFGPLNTRNFPKGVSFQGVASLARTEDRVDIRFTTAVSDRADRGELKIDAIVKELNGDDGITGRINSPLGWATLTSFLTQVIAGYTLSTLTTSVTQAGTVVDVTVANQIRQALGSAVAKTGAEIEKALWKKGSRVEIQGGSIVQVYFKETTSSW